MRVLIVNHYAVPPDRPGGARHYKLARGLQESGHDVTIVAGSFDHRTRTEFRLKAGEKHRLQCIEGVPYMWLRTPAYQGNSPARARNIAAFAWSVWRRSAILGMPRPDVVVGSSPTPLAALAAQRVARKWRVPFVLEVRDLWPDSLIDLGRLSQHNIAIRLLRSIERVLYRESAAVVSLLPGAVGHVASIRGSAEAVTWIPNGVDVEHLPVPFRRQTGGRFVVTYAGAHGMANGLDVVLDAAAWLQVHNPAVVIRLVGDGPEKARLMTRAASLRLGNVEFVDPVPKHEVHTILSDSDACLMPLVDSPVFRWGISPNKLFDYMAAARPIVFSVSSEYNPVSQAGAGITVPPDDAVAMGTAVNRLADLPAIERWEMGMRGYEYLRRHHDMASLALKFEEVLVSVVR